MGDVMADLPDFSTCDREPVAFINQIQQFGALIVLDAELNVVQVSENVEAWLEVSKEDLLGLPAVQFLTERQFDVLTTFVASPHLTSTTIGLIPPRGTAVAHKSGRFVLLEVEAREHLNGGPDEALGDLKASSQLISKQRKIEELMPLVARAVKKIAGYERVMIYRFHQDWHGEVIAEEVDEGCDSYIGHHFPASDIPEPARRLFAANWIRVIEDVSAEPVGLFPAVPEGYASAVDLTPSMLRQPSPIHIEYLKNMDVGASMTISLMVENQLWGLIACHHRSARHLGYWLRSTCEFVGKHASQQLTRVVKDQANQLVSRFARIAEGALQAASPREVMKAVGTDLKKALSASAAIYVALDGGLYGDTKSLPAPVLLALTDWLLANPREFFFSNRMCNVVPAFANASSASGLISVRAGDGYLVVLRPEYLQTWGGDPNKAVRDDVGGRIHPRNSFAAWTEDVRGKSLDWAEGELLAAQALGALFDASASVHMIDMDANFLCSEMRGSLERSLRAVTDLCDDKLCEPRLRLKLESIGAQYRDLLDALPAGSNGGNAQAS
jgi:two-component system, chemotaxis family, sensor kinase Cph1